LPIESTFQLFPTYGFSISIGCETMLELVSVTNQY